MQLREMSNHGQAEAQAAMHPGYRAVGLPEALEQPWEQRRLDPGAGVADGQLQVLAGAREADVDATSAGRELDRVGEEVPHHLLEPIRVPEHETGLCTERDLDGDALRLRRRRYDVEGGVDDRVE